ncbi:lipoprotein LpqB-like beta-propeller protein [Micromonospora pisi]|uniref:Lipoprotein LpqB-like beta-propeller protein n=1 Tax=Micromonospora pisi TaxID=589240 RepID=A0A495JNY8_9ACTN|nr:LpqB family beta-propeller domain-containing protein [Micromonospora pisi]RKR90345.1 lipoprotein LpqB-like beta-propeller protein [Micromonospora pisi]
MRRPNLPAATVAVLICVGLAGCGIPAETEVRVDGRGPQSGQGIGDGPTPSLPVRSDSSTPEKFTTNYLTAAAAGGETSEIYDRVNSYIADDRAKLKQKPGGEPAINVIRLLGGPRARLDPDKPGGYLVTIQVQQVGVLRGDGAVGEPELTDRSYEFKVAPISNTVGTTTQPVGGLWMINPPQVLLLSTDALTDYYTARTIYFWNAGRTTLVPDLRYLSTSVPRESQATEILGWLIGGPVPWLLPAAVPLPEGTSRIGNAPNQGDRLEVNLSVPASEVNDEVELDRIFTQLAWSLVPPDSEAGSGDEGDMELKIQSQQRKVADIVDYRRAHPPYGITGNPKRYCVVDGVVYPLRIGNESPMAVPVQQEQNHDVRYAAFTGEGDRTAAALVTEKGNGFELRVASGAEPLRTFGTSRTFDVIDRPVWLRGADPHMPIGLVVADGALYRFDGNGQFDGKGQPAKVEVPGVTGRITGVGASPDGHRIALIADNVLYVAALSTDGGAVTVGRARQLATSLNTVTAVDWIGESLLAVAGAQPDKRSIIENVSVDGVSEVSVVDDTRGDVLYLAAYPQNPLSSTDLGVMYEAEGLASLAQVPIERGQVDMPAPAPNSSVKPSAPFFRY